MSSLTPECGLKQVNTWLPTLIFADAARTKQSQIGRGGLLSAFCGFCVCAGGSGEGFLCFCVPESKSREVVQPYRYRGFLFSVAPEFIHIVRHLMLNNNLKQILSLCQRMQS